MRIIDNRLTGIFSWCRITPMPLAKAINPPFTTPVHPEPSRGVLGLEQASNFSTSANGSLTSKRQKSGWYTGGLFPSKPLTAMKRSTCCEELIQARASSITPRRQLTPNYSAFVPNL